MVEVRTEQTGSPLTEDTSAGAVEALFREHNEALLRFLRPRLANDADAREAAQEAYVRLLQLNQPEQPSFLRAYLFKIAANVATDILRRRKTRGVAAPAEAADRPDPALQERALAAREELCIIQDALAELPARCREAFILHRHEGWTTVQISLHLKVTDRMVRLYLVRALEHVQLALSRQEMKAPVQ